MSSTLLFTREMFSISAAYTLPNKTHIYGIRKAQYGEPYIIKGFKPEQDQRVLDFEVNAGFMNGDFLAKMYNSYLFDICAVDDVVSIPLWVSPRFEEKEFSFALEAQTKDSYGKTAKAFLTFRSVRFKGVRVNDATYKGGTTFSYLFQATEVYGAIADFSSTTGKESDPESLDKGFGQGLVYLAQLQRDMGIPKPE